MTTSPPPRRKWNISRWLFVFALLAMTWSGWRAYAFRSALAQAKAMGWVVYYTDPVETIRKNWKAAFKKETWLNGVTDLDIRTNVELEVHPAILEQLNPRAMHISYAGSLRDLSALESLTRLRQLWLNSCTALTNLDGLKNLSSLQRVELTRCTGLTNVDALSNLTSLQYLVLNGCKRLTNVDALKNLTALQDLDLCGCKGLTNVDALENLSALKKIYLFGCTGLTNVDALKSLSTLQKINLFGCPGLTKESVAPLRSALPNAEIHAP